MPEPPTTQAFAQAVLEAAPPLVILDEELRVQRANETFYREFHVSPEQTENRVIYDLDNSQWDTPALHTLLEEILCPDRPLRNHEVTLDLGGRGPRTFLLSARQVESANGKPRAVVLCLNNITESKQAEAARLFLALIVESLQDSIVALDADNLITAWNRAAERLYGYSAREVLGRPLTLFMLPEDRDQVIELMDKVRSGHTVERFETHRVHKDGHHLHLSIQLSPIKDEAGRLLGISTLARDITPRKQAEEALLQSEAKFRTLTQTIPQLVWSCSPEGQCDYLSPQWGDYTGIPSHEQLGQKWVKAVHPEDRAATGARWKAAVERREPFELEYRLRNAQGEYRWFQVRAAPILDVEGRVTKWFGTCTDIEEQKRAQDNLERVVAERTAALRETVSELEAFSYSMAHDMRAPLRAMSSFAHLISQSYGASLDERGREMLERLCSSAERLDLLIQDVLSYSRVLRDKAPLGPVDLDRLLRELVATYPDWAPPRAQVQIQGQIPPVIGHRGFLTQCISNLVENAIKFVAPGVQPQVQIWAEPLGDTVRLNVRDNGIGIAPEHRDRVFGMLERIYPASEYEGTGIGLTIVRKAVRRMSGQVGFDSEPGKGSTFWLELKRADPGPEQSITRMGK